MGTHAKIALLAVAAAIVGGGAVAGVDPCDLYFARLASRRFMLDNELPLCEYNPKTVVAAGVQHPVTTNGLRVVGGYWPVAHYRARVESLPAEIAFAHADGTVVWRFPVEAGEGIPEPPFDFSVLLRCKHGSSTFVTKDGHTRLLCTANAPDGLNPRLRENLSRLKFCISTNVPFASASLSAGIGQADVRFVTAGRQNRLYMENNRAFFVSAYRYSADAEPSEHDRNKEYGPESEQHHKASEYRRA